MAGPLWQGALLPPQPFPTVPCVTHTQSTGLARVGSQLAKHGAVCSPWWLGVTWWWGGEFREAGMPLGAYLLLEVEGLGAYLPQEPPSSSPYQWVTSLPEHPFSSWTPMSVLRTSPGAHRRPGKPALTWAYTEPLPQAHRTEKHCQIPGRPGPGPPAPTQPGAAPATEARLLPRQSSAPRYRVEIATAF